MDRDLIGIWFGDPSSVYFVFNLFQNTLRQTTGTGLRRPQAVSRLYLLPRDSKTMATNVGLLDLEAELVSRISELSDVLNKKLNRVGDNAESKAVTVDPAPGPSTSNSNSSPSPSAPQPEGASESLNLPLRRFVWGVSPLSSVRLGHNALTSLMLQEKVVRNALPHATIPPWLDPLHVDIDDPRKLPLCWYGVPFYSDVVFAYAKRIRLGVYLKHALLNLKPGDLDIYQTWPKLVKWFEGESGLTMHLHQVWGERKPLLTFFSNHEMARVTEDMWEITGDLLDDMDYPEDCKPLWYLDRRLDVRVCVSVHYAPCSARLMRSPAVLVFEDFFLIEILSSLRVCLAFAAVLFFKFEFGVVSSSSAYRDCAP